jgi:hypothetical protein
MDMLKIAKQSIINVRGLPLRYLKGLASRPEKLYISTKHKNYNKLAEDRINAIKQGFLISDSEDYVPASIKYNNIAYDVKMRLKGIWLDNLEGDKWSLRVKVKNSKTIMGMRVFSLQHPQVRNYIYEWIYQEALRNEGIIALRYKFIEVILNGKNLGIFALEEHMNKRLIENNQLKEGPIIRFSDKINWLRYQDTNKFGVWDDNDNYFTSEIDAFESSRISSSSVLRNQYKEAVSLLENFRNGNLNTSDVFDVDKLAKYVALSEILGATYGFRYWNNAKFYYNPTTQKLEPIGMEGNPWNGYIKGELIFFGQESEFLNTIFQDINFFKQYIARLKQYSEPEYFESLHSKLNESLNENISILDKEFPYKTFNRKLIEDNQSLIKNLLSPPKALNVYYHSYTDQTLKLTIGNIQQFPIEIENIISQNGVIFKALENIVIPPNRRSTKVDYNSIQFEISDKDQTFSSNTDTLKIGYRVLGSGITIYEEVLPLKSFISNDTSNMIKENQELSEIPFISLDKKNKLVRFKTGDWELNHNLIIPPDYLVICGGGFNLNLRDSATILSYSPLQLIGEKDHFIVIQSKDSTGGGIIVLNAGQKSILDYVKFDNLSNPSALPGGLSGAITFYESDVTILNCILNNNIRGDDYLNIVRSEFDIRNTLFRNTNADALDVDFGFGTISSSSFINCGNDAIDISGTILEINGTVINTVGDKGLSVGERSRVSAKNMEISNSEIAICSKDISEIEVNEIVINSCKVGFTAFQKKDEFGPATIEGKNITLNDVLIPFLIEQDSKCTIDTIPIKSDTSKIKDILYGVKYGIKST